jgi:hypothetical protein
LFPVIRLNVSLADFARLLVANILCLTVLYFAAVFSALSWTSRCPLCLPDGRSYSLLWLAHHVAPSVDIILVYGAASPVLTHRLPWSQIAAPQELPLPCFCGRSGCADA